MTKQTVAEAPSISSEARLPVTRTRQAFDRNQTVEWMEDSGIWGVSYPISGDTLASLRAAAKV
jgi:hypothetical protein